MWMFARRRKFTTILNRGTRTITGMVHVAGCGYMYVGSDTGIRVRDTMEAVVPRPNVRVEFKRLTNNALLISVA